MTATRCKIRDITNKPQNIKWIRWVLRITRYFEASHRRTICPPCMCVKGAQIMQKLIKSALPHLQSSIRARCRAISKAGHPNGHGFGIFGPNAIGSLHGCPKRTPIVFPDSRNARRAIYSRRRRNRNQTHPMRQPRT